MVGPTSSGKTAMSIEIAKKRSGEVISADSRQVYKGLNIGTGKVTKKEMRGVPHHLLDVCSPKKLFTAEDFVRLGRAKISEILARGKTPIICGGTGFYIDALVGKRQFPQVPINETLRKKLDALPASKLFAMLEKKDPERAKTIDKHNPRRLVRALEIVEALGKVPVLKSEEIYDCEWIGIEWPMEKLEKRIHDRLLARVKQGMVREATNLHTAGLTYKRMDKLGLEYRWLALLLQKKISKEEFLQGLEKEIVQYAKRQMTWWKPNKGIIWKKL